MSKIVDGILIDQQKFKKCRCKNCGSDDLILRLSTDNFSRSEYICNKCGDVDILLYDDIVKVDGVDIKEYGSAEKRNPYINSATEAYVTAINILAVEYLIKTRDLDKYTRYVKKVEEFDTSKLEQLYHLLSLNMHTSSLGAMITQHDYDVQTMALLNFLNAEMVKCPNCGTFAAAEYYGSLKNVKYYRCSCCATKFVVAEEK